jgi:hypothetical protein
VSLLNDQILSGFSRAFRRFDGSAQYKVRGLALSQTADSHGPHENIPLVHMDIAQTGPEHCQQSQREASPQIRKNQTHKTNGHPMK